MYGYTFQVGKLFYCQDFCDNRTPSLHVNSQRYQLFPGRLHCLASLFILVWFFDTAIFLLLAVTLSPQKTVTKNVITANYPPNAVNFHKVKVVLTQSF